ncbi:hypothetical protein DAI22_12g164700 [Oryza sativa Japonica Group]|nr:hypothetical protein DAI22_12g164700 [Oryza sativa Japonica Group]
MAWLFIVVIVMGLDTRNNCELLGTAKKMRPKRKRSVQVMQDDKDVYINETSFSIVPEELVQERQHSTSVLTTLLEQATSTQSSINQLGPLPDSVFIEANRNTLPQPRATTSTHVGRARMKRSNTRSTTARSSRPPSQKKKN